MPSTDPFAFFSETPPDPDEVDDTQALKRAGFPPTQAKALAELVQRSEIRSRRAFIAARRQIILIVAVFGLAQLGVLLLIWRLLAAVTADLSA